MSPSVSFAHNNGTIVVRGPYLYCKSTVYVYTAITNKSSKLLLLSCTKIIHVLQFAILCRHRYA